MYQDNLTQEGKSLRRSRIAFWVIAAVAAYFLLVEHREHVVGFLPYALILACPLMHVFHRGHGGHPHGDHASMDRAAGRAADTGASLDKHRH
jgi:hypothetical protein